MPRVGGVHRRELPNIGILLRENPVFDVGVDGAVPWLGDIGGQAGEIPVGHFKQTFRRDVRSDGSAVDNPVCVQIHNAGTHHPVKVRTIPVEIKVNFCAINICNAALIVEIIIVVSKIGLSEIGLRIIDNKLDFFGRGIIQHPLNLFDNLRSFLHRVFREGLAVRVKIDIVLRGTEILPVLLLVLHTVFPEGDVGAVVELGFCRIDNEQHSERHAQKAENRGGRTESVHHKKRLFKIGCKSS